MHAFNSILVTSCLLAHALFGCCWHHSHDCVAHEAIAYSGGGCNDHGCPAKHSEPCNCRIECGAICVYLPIEKTVIDCSPVTFDLVATNPTLFRDESANLLSWELASGLAASAPPLRLHLLHQILVI